MFNGSDSTRNNKGNRGYSSNVNAEEDYNYSEDTLLTLTDGNKSDPDKFRSRMQALQRMEEYMAKPPKKIRFKPDPNNSTDELDDVVMEDENEKRKYLKTSISCTTLYSPIDGIAIDALKTIYPDARSLIVESGGLKGCLALIDAAEQEKRNNPASNPVSYKFDPKIIERINRLTDSEEKKRFLNYCLEQRLSVSPGHHEFKN